MSAKRQKLTHQTTQTTQTTVHIPLSFELFSKIAKSTLNVSPFTQIILTSANVNFSTRSVDHMQIVNYDILTQLKSEVNPSWVNIPANKKVQFIMNIEQVYKMVANCAETFRGFDVTISDNLYDNDAVTFGVVTFSVVDLDNTKSESFFGLTGHHFFDLPTISNNYVKIGKDYLPRIKNHFKSNGGYVKHHWIKSTENNKIIFDGFCCNGCHGTELIIPYLEQHSNNPNMVINFASGENNLIQFCNVVNKLDCNFDFVLQQSKDGAILKISQQVADTVMANYFCCDGYISRKRKEIIHQPRQSGELLTVPIKLV